MDNPNLTSPSVRCQTGNTGDDSSDPENHYLDGRRINQAAMIPDTNGMMNQGSVISSVLQQQQALLALGGQLSQQDYATLMASAARSMLLLQGANAAAGQSSAPGQAYTFPSSVAMQSPAGQGQPWLMAMQPQPQPQPQLSIAGIDPRLLAQFGGAEATPLRLATAAPSPHQMIAASALLSQIGQANQQHPNLAQLQQQPSANLGSALQPQFIPRLSSQYLPACSNSQAAALGSTAQGDATSLLRALLSQQQNNATAAHLVYPLIQTAVTSLVPSLPESSFGAGGSPGAVTHAAGASAASPHQDSPLTGRPPVCLHLDLDEQTLSDYQCLLRKHIELFETRPEDIQSGVQGRNTPIRVGQVGIRCRHCANVRRAETNTTSNPAPPARRPKKGTIYYSRTLDGLYQVAQNLTKVHLCNSCPNIPGEVKARLSEMQKVNKRTSGGKEYWVYGLKELGVYEDNHLLRFRHLSAGGLDRDAPQGLAMS